MSKTGRNDPCHCGSGKKYKRCCLEKDEAAASVSRHVDRLVSGIAPELEPGQEPFLADALDIVTASNAVVDLVHDGRLDEAERIARDLVEQYPDLHDGYDRLGMVYEARGDNKQAADWYRKVIAMVEEHPEDYEPGFVDTFHRLVARLDPPVET